MTIRALISRSFAGLAVFLLLGQSIAGTGDRSWEFAPAVHIIRLEINADAEASLHQQPRRRVTAQMVADGRAFPDVSLHLKGATGSFQPLPEKPSFTVDLARKGADREFLDTKKFHLNNSAEDPCYLNELIGSELFRTAGIPSPRVTHALVSLNGRRLGLYVMKEGFTAEFLNRSFPDENTQLLEPEPGQDVDGRMQAHLGRRGPNTAHISPTRSLAEAATETDIQTRWQRLSEQLDLDQFITLMAVEVMIGHRDGYALAKNNFRIASNPNKGKFSFLPHGMDQLFQRPNLSWKPHMAGLVARAVWETPEGRRRYEERFSTLLPQLLVVPELERRLREKVRQLRPFLTPQEGADLAREASAFGEHISERATALRGQLLSPPTALEFAKGSEHPGGWIPMDAPTGGRLDEASDQGGKSLRITAGPVTAASWRTTVRLNPGHYRFSSRVSTRGIKPLAFGQNQGAAIRVAGERPRSLALMDNFTWQPLTTEFVVGEPNETVQLICELRASAGEARFDRDSLELTRLD